MKKKIYLTLFCIVMSLMCLYGCTITNKTENIYSKLNKMSEATYSNITLDVASTVNDSELRSRYDVSISDNITSISYSYEQLNSFEIIDEKLIAPEEYKTVKVGTLIVEGNKIVEQNGAEIDIPIENITLPKLSFKKLYFSNVSEGDGKFSADVINVNGFTGKDLACTDMHTTVKFQNGKFTSVTISYVSEKGANVVIGYTLGIN